MGWWFWKPSGNVQRINQALTESFTKVKQDVLHVHEWIRFLHKQNEYQAGLIKELTDELRNAHDRTPSQHEIRTLIRQEVEDANEGLKKTFSRHLIHNGNAVKAAVKRQVHDQMQSVHHQVTKEVNQKMHQVQREVSEHFKRYNETVFERLRTMESKLAPEADVTTNKQAEIFERLATVMEKLEQRTSNPVPQPIIQPQPIVQNDYTPPTNQGITKLQRQVLRKVQRNSKEYVKNVMLSMIRRYQQLPGLHIKEMLVDEQQLVSKSSLYRLLNELADEGRISVSQDGKEKLYHYNSDLEPAKENENV